MYFKDITNEKSRLIQRSIYLMDYRLIAHTVEALVFSTMIKVQ